LKDGKGYIKEHIKGKSLFEGEYEYGQKNGKGTEYYFGFLDRIKFEGEYLNGNKWNGLIYYINGVNITKYELKDGKGYIKEYTSGKSIFEGEYKYGKKNGKGKEYGNSKIFEGEYLNGEKNGQGKEYDNFKNTLIFEGEYKNGRRNGKGKEYDDNGKLKFEGDYLYGYKIKGKYYIDGILEFEGEYNYEKKWNGKGYDEKRNIIYELNNGNGTVKEYDYYKGKLMFKGEYINGKRNGKGAEYNYDGKLIFVGEYYDGKKWNGKGYDEKENIIYELNNGNGNIKEYDYDGNLTFEGEYKSGERSGKGKEYYYGKLTFEGDYLNGDRNGKGKEYDNKQLRFIGEFLNGKRNGRGFDCCGYEGEYLNGVKNGKGKEYDPFFGMLIYEGEFINGKRNGKGKEYNRNGTVKFEGEFINGNKLEK